MTTPSPLLVHTMGKVGSSSVLSMLEGREDFVSFQTHQLNQERLRAFTKWLEDRDLPIPNHVETSYKVLREIIPAHDRIRIISLVREPVGRNISAFFQNLQNFGYENEQAAEVPPQELVKTFQEKFDHAVPLKWFDQQMLKALDIDVYAHPFPKDDGYVRFQSGKYDTLIMRCELPDAEKLTAMQDFLGVQDLKLERKRVTRDAVYGDAYRDVLDRISFDRDFLKTMYESRYAQHFYTGFERKLLMDKWSRGAH